MCTAPEKVLVVPSGIGNAASTGSAEMLPPLIQYGRTKADRWIKKAALLLSSTSEVSDEDTLKTVKSSFTHVKTKMGTPSSVGKKKMKCCIAPPLVLTSKYDCLFPAKKVLKRTGNIIPNCARYELSGREHTHILTAKEKRWSFTWRLIIRQLPQLRRNTWQS